MTRGTRSLSTLGRDQRGAVMLMGVFMACALVGALWSLVGIGQAIVFRDRMQETADAVVFSSASVHARGMNFIAALNLIMLAVVAIHMALGIVHYALLAIATALDACALTVVGAPICGGPAASAHSAASSVLSAWVTYTTGAKPVLISGAAIQSATSVLAPWGGQLAALDIASKYGQTAFMVSPSLFPTIVPTFTPGTGGSPGDAASAGSGSAGPGGVSLDKPSGVDLSKPAPVDLSKPTDATAGTFGVIPGKLGLPVEEQKMQFLCSHVAQAVIFWAKDALKQLPVIGSFFNFPGVETAVNIAIGFGGDAVMLALCNDSGGVGVPYPSLDIFWKGVFVGPKKIWTPARNGNDWLQVWAFVTDAKYTELAERKVALADGAQGLMAGTDPVVPTYNAQAEFYYDCKSDWTACNQNDTPAFSMRWKVRLRRFRTPNVAGMLAGLGAEVLFSNGVVDFLRGKVKNTAPFRNLETRIGALSGFKRWLGDKGLESVTRNDNAAALPNSIAEKVRQRLASDGTPAGDGAYH